MRVLILTIVLAYSILGVTKDTTIELPKALRDAPGFVSAPQVLGPYSATLNYSVDLLGTQDLRPGTWGLAKAVPVSYVFATPPGYRVRIVWVSGDLVAVPTSYPTPAVMSPGTYAEVGFGLKNTSYDGPSGFIPENTFVWCQNFVLPGNPSPRASFSQNTAPGGLLESDNSFIAQVFVALNTSGLLIHIEPTFTVTYQFERSKVK